MHRRLASRLAAAVMAGAALVGGACGPPPAASKQAASAMARYDQGKTLFSEGRYTRAAAAFQTWLRAYPKHPLEPAALYYLARSQTKARQLEKAKTTYEQVAKDYPDTDWGKFAREDLASLGAKEPHLPPYRPRYHWWHPWDWFAGLPPDVRAFEAARKNYDKRRFDQALTTFAALAEGDPSSPLTAAALYYVGKTQSQLGQPDKAREAFDRLATAYGHTPWARLANEELRRLQK